MAYEITKGKRQRAQKVVVYGPEGIGKSTFASKFPNPLFIDTEGGTDYMDVARLPNPKSWTELVNEVNYVMDHPNICGTLIIDTMDWAEKLAIENLCATKKIPGIEDLGYGKGYTYVSEDIGKLLNILEQVKNRGINIVVTAHATMRKFEQPDELGAYDRWELKLSKKSASLVKEWSDMLLFANYKTYVTQSDTGKNKVTGGTKRVMYTEHTATYDAKNRFGLPKELPFDYAPIANVIESAKTVEPSAAINSAETVKPQTAPAQTAAQTAKTQEEIPKAITSKPQTRAADVQPEPDTEFDEMPELTEPSQPDVSAEDAPPKGVPEALWALMKVNNVTVLEVEAAVASKGYYPIKMDIADYAPDFVKGVLIGAWPKVEKIIMENRENDPF